MAIWIIIAILSQFINAIVALIDRYIVVSGKVGRPIILTFYVSLLSALGVVVFFFSWIPFSFGNINLPSFANLSFPNLSLILVGLLSAVSFILALYYLFSSFKLSAASDVVPVISSVSAISTLLFSFYILDSTLTDNFLWGFCFLVLGTFLIAKFRMTKQLLVFCLVSGVFFGLHFVLMKLLFSMTLFDNAFFWSRIFIAVSALFMLFLPDCCGRSVADNSKNTGKAGLFLVLFNKALAGLASILALKAIELGDVSIVQAMSGLQFVFLLIFSLFFGHKAPKCIGEHCEIIDRIQKLVSVSIIVTGFSLLFI